ncbi:hypothetical protein CVT06_02880 [Campylobacter concisus]|uniref:Uncharacterized protein n=2 Tax=Campylobacter concisus TaxID=199 RepID=A0A7S9NGM6_9BACT|nr:hypothetical protein CVT06_02880 [Campylobacter concisus]
MKKFWGLRPYMEISDFISSVKPKQLLSNEFNDILSKCVDVREYLCLANLAFELENGENRQKIIKTILKKVLQECQEPWGYFYIARSVYENLNDKKLAKKIIIKQIKRFKINDYFLLCKQNILSKKQIKTAIKSALSSGMKRQRFVNLLDRLSEIDKYSLVCRKFYKKAKKLPTDNDAYDEECLIVEERTQQRLDQIHNKNTKTK